jgi:Acetyltransferase (isoleucine patch superfamily)
MYLTWDEKLFVLRKMLLMPMIRNQYGHLGKGSCIQRQLMIHGKKNIYIGEKVYIRPGARIETISEWKLGEGYTPFLSIGNRVNIEQGVHITCADKIVIENDVVILSNVLITDINHSYQNIDTPFLAQPLEVKAVHIGQYSVIGSGARILPGVNIGKNVIIGANAVVTKSVSDYTIVAGIPAQVIRKYNFETREWERV